MTEAQASVFLWGIFEMMLKLVVPFVALLLVVKVLRIARTML